MIGGRFYLSYLQNFNGTVGWKKGDSSMARASSNEKGNCAERCMNHDKYTIRVLLTGSIIRLNVA